MRKRASGKNTRETSTGESKPPRRRGKKRPRWRAAKWPRGALLFLGALAICGSMILAVLWLWGSDASERVAGEGVHLYKFVVSTSDPVAVAAQLEEAGLISDVHAFTWYQRVFFGGARIEVGSHIVPAGASARELVKLLARHRSRASRDVSFPEGFDLFQVAERLERHGVCIADEFVLAALDRNEAALELDAPSFEGYLYPATYSMRLNSTPDDVLTRLVGEAKRRFATVFAERAAELAVLERELGLIPHDAVTLASIVQKETAAKEEVGLVASVFLNRLRDPSFKPRAALQSDPTAGYGCKLPEAPPSCRDFEGRIGPELLRDPANGYNTYRHAGLPPGPISNPSAEVLDGVLTAPRSEYLYFVASKGGRHVFSRTFQEHRAAIVADGEP